MELSDVSIVLCVVSQRELCHSTTPVSLYVVVVNIAIVPSTRQVLSILSSIVGRQL